MFLKVVVLIIVTSVWLYDSVVTFIFSTGFRVIMVIAMSYLVMYDQSEQLRNMKYLPWKLDNLC